MARIVVLASVFTVLAACNIQTERPSAVSPEGGAFQALTLVRPGAFFHPGEPFWFELGPEGPRLIPSPGEASLNPFVPWSHARYITAFLPGASPGIYDAGASAEVLFAGVNRGGLLGFERRNTGTAPAELAVYYHRETAPWEDYALISLFRYGGEPAVLLGRDRFFSTGEQRIPEKALWTLGPGGLQELALPLFEDFSPARGWESSALFQASGGWYYRQIRRDGKEGPLYFRAADLSGPGERISPESFLEAAGPGSPAPALLTVVLEEAERLAGKPCIATVVSEEYGSPRLYQSRPGPGAPDGEAPLEVSGYYRPPLQNGGGLALVLLPDGRGAYGVAGGASLRDGHISLPALSGQGGEGFRYTAAAVTGNVLVAAWEEQRDWNIGAAGFLLLEIDL
ncbi:MAG: hypothetical protein LBE02_08490 [Spirochaetaceae bacterium]|jgi:hypothetical protein|nr:hypothetical protein [Spirochaetaceae bacterium]